jgi:hypothetical protein
MKADGTNHAALKRMYGEKSKAEKVARPMFKVAVGGRHEQCRGGRGGHTFQFSPQISAVDSGGMSRLLQKHESVFAARMVAF